MRVLFIHDYQFIHGKDGWSCGEIQFSYHYWKRYLEFFDEIVISGQLRGMKSGEQGRDISALVGPGVTFLELPQISGPAGMIGGVKEVQRRIRKALQECDAMIARDCETGWQAYPVAKSMGKLWGVEVCGCFFEKAWNCGTWRERMFASYAAYKVRRMVEAAPYALYGTRQFLQRRYPSNGKIANCFDIPLGKTDKKVLEKRLAAVRRTKSLLKFGLIGSLHNQAEAETILKSLGKLKGRLPSFEFRIFGADDKEAWQTMAIREGVSEHIRFQDAASGNDEMIRWLDGLDAYIQPGYREGLPWELITAMSRGCPAVGNFGGSIPELLAVECMYRTDDADGLSALLFRVANDKHWSCGQAKRNFHEASQYEQSVSDGIRRNFWLDFVRCSQYNPISAAL